MTSVLLWQLYRRQSNWRTYQSALVRSKKLLIKKRKQTLWLTVVMKNDIKSCYGLLLQRGLQEIETTSDVLPKWFWRNQAKSDNDCDKNCPSELPSLHYDAFTTPKPGYTKRIFPLISISTLPPFTSGSTRRLQLFQSAGSLITKEAYLTCSMHINTDKKTLDRWGKSINYV